MRNRRNRGACTQASDPVRDARWIAKLHHVSAIERAEAVQRIAEAGQPSVEHARHVAAALHDESKWVRRAAADGLGKLGILALPHVDALARLLNAGGYAEKCVAANALQELGVAAASAADALASVISSWDFCCAYDLMGPAMGALGNCGEAAVPHIDVLITQVRRSRSALSDVSSECGQLAATAIGNIGPVAGDAAAEELAATMLDKDAFVVLRLCAADAFGKLSDSAAPFSIDIIPIVGDEDEDSVLRQRVVDALALLKIPQGPARDALRSIAIETASLPIRHASLKALENIEERERVRIVTCTPLVSFESDACVAAVSCTNVAGEEIADVPCATTSTFAFVRASIAGMLCISEERLWLLSPGGQTLADCDLIVDVQQWQS